MQTEREEDLRSQADSLAIQMATIHYQKAERRTKVLETSRTMLALHSLLIQQLRERKSLERQDVAQMIQSHVLVRDARLPAFPRMLLTALSLGSKLTLATGNGGSRATATEGEDRVG